MSESKIPLIKIYLISNSFNEKKYVGQTTASLEERFARNTYPCMKSKNMPIVFAVQKHGKKNFSIKEIDTASSVKEANEKEVYWGNFYNCLSPHGYNLKLGGRFCVETSEITKQRISESNKGKPKHTEEMKEHFRQLSTGRKHSNEAKQKVSEFWKGKKKSKYVHDRSSQENSIKFILKNQEGEIITSQGVKKFAKENNLPVEKLRKLIKGAITELNGWTLIENLGFKGKRDKKNE